MTGRPGGRLLCKCGTYTTRADGICHACTRAGYERAGNGKCEVCQRPIVGSKKARAILTRCHVCNTAGTYDEHGGLTDGRWLHTKAGVFVWQPDRKAS